VRPSKVIALILLLALPLTGRGQELTYASAKPAPASYTKLVWDYGGKLTVGYWYTAEQVQKIDLRIRYLEDTAAKECADANIAATKEVLGMSTMFWVGIGTGVVAGLVGGYFIGKAVAK
jgi:hypothetical protein